MVVPTDEIPIFHKVRSKEIGYGESESGVGFSKFRIIFFSSMVVPTDEIPIFHKVRSKEIGYEGFESVNKLSKMGIKFCETIETFFLHNKESKHQSTK